MKLLASILLLIGLTANAATYYVDYDSGADSNAGSSGAPFKHCPGDPMATGTAASTTLAAGDTVIFKGGVSYILTHQNPSTGTTDSGIVAKSGTAASMVTYDGNSAGTFGTGKAIISNGCNQTNQAAFYTSGTFSNIVFKNITFQYIGGATNLPADTGSELPAKYGAGISASTAMKNVQVLSCDFYKMGYYQNSKPSGNSAIDGHGIFAGSTDGLTVSNCNFAHMRLPLQIAVGNVWNTTITRCNFRDECEWALSVLCVDSYRSNLTISYCTWTNTDQWYVSTADGGLWTAYDSYPHCNGIMMFNGEGSGGASALDRSPGDTNVFIHHNFFINTTDYTGGTTWIWLQDGTSGAVYNNVFNNVHAVNAAVQVSEPPTNGLFRVWVVNNTMWSKANVLASCAAQVDGNYWAPASGTERVTWWNNVFSSANQGYNNFFDYSVNTSTGSFSKFTNNVDFDWNFYRSDQTYSTNGMVFGYYVALTDYIMTNNCVSGYGWDANSRQGDPLFTTVSTSDSTLNDFTLQSSSPAIGIGTNLTALGFPELTTDFRGTNRVSSGAWDVGAYTYTAGSGGGGGTASRPGNQIRGNVRVGGNLIRR